MSDNAKLRKLLRRKKLLDFLEKDNRVSLAVQAQELSTLRSVAAQMDRSWQDGLDLQFLDMHVAYRHRIAPQLRRLENSLESDMRRASVLMQRVEETASQTRFLEDKIVSVSENEQLLDGLKHKVAVGVTVSHKPAGQ